jgi:hypothetical protein
MSTRETIDWLDELEQRFTGAGGAAHEQRVLVAGGVVVLRAAGRAMLDRVAPAFAHLPDASGEEPDLVVQLWDSREAPESRPPLPTAEGQPRGAVYFHAAGALKVSCQPGLEILSAYDEATGRAWFWSEGADTLPFWEASAPLRQIFHWWLSPRSVSLLHGAAVGRPDGGVLLVGRGGSGKSTSALSCLQSELLYAGDDYVAVEERARPWVHSLFSTGKLEPGHAKRLPHLPAPTIGDDAAEKLVFYVQGRYPDRTCEGFPLRAVLAPRITGGETRMVPVSPAAALRALAPSTLLQLHPPDPGAFTGMARLLGSVPAYSFELGPRIEEIPAAIERFLDTLEES